VPYVGEIRMFAGNFAPDGWLLCDGSLQDVDDNQTLFSLIGDTYGGDGVKTFALPDFRGRVSMHMGKTELGTRGGLESVPLGQGQMPAHTHALAGTIDPGIAPDPGGNVLARTGPSGGSTGLYALDDPAVAMDASSIAPTGGGTAHENRQPYLCVNVIISLYGSFPSPV
jgi:microcystin-dependent protein